MKLDVVKRRRLLRIVAILLILLVAVLYIGFPLVMAFAAITPHYNAEIEPPEGFADITVTTADGLNLGAWYVEPANGAVIILVHGAGSGRESAQAYAQMLHEQGFGVLALNMSGYGDSEGASIGEGGMAHAMLARQSRICKGATTCVPSVLWGCQWSVKSCSALPQPIQQCKRLRWTVQLPVPSMNTAPYP